MGRGEHADRPGGGGFLLVHRARDGHSRLLDFVSVPGAGLEADTISEMDAIAIDFDDSSTQAFGIGVSSVATPGVVAGSRGRTARTGECRGQRSSRRSRSHARES